MTIEFRLLDPSEIGDAVKLWKACGLNRPWNNPFADARRALERQSSTIMASFSAGHLIGTAMCGWDGHRGWIYYLGVDSDFRRWGIGRKLTQLCEDWLSRFGASKIQLMVHAENNEVARFYETIGYEEESFRFFYRRITTKRHSEKQSEAP